MAHSYFLPTGEPNVSPKQLALMQLCRAKTGIRKVIGVFGTRLAGKCVTPDTLIYTANGVMPISMLGNAPMGEFSPCEKEVACLDVENSKITTSNTDQFLNSGIMDGYTIRTDGGYELSCSDIHPIWCSVDSEVGYFTSTQIKVAKELGSKIWFPILRENKHWPEAHKVLKFEYFSGRDRQKYEASKRAQTGVGSGYYTHIKYTATPFVPKSIEVTIDSEVAYLVGLMVGDGCYTKPVLKTHGCRFSGIDQSMLESLKMILFKNFPESKVTSRKKCDHDIQSASFRKFLYVTGMAGKYSYEKIVPDIIYGSPKDVVVGFLQGLFDTDGTVCKNGNTYYCSSSRELAHGVQNLLMSIGVRSRVTMKKTKCRDTYILATFREDDFGSKVGFRLKRKQDKIAKDRKWTLNRSCYPPAIIQSIKKLKANRRERGVGMLSRFIHLRTIGNLLRENISISRRSIEPVLKLLKCENEPEIQKYICNWEIWWDEISSMTPIRTEMVDLSVPKYRNFITNGFISHNSQGCMACIADHLWNTENASVLILVKTAGSGAASGIWSELTEKVLPAWIAQGFGMEWAEKGEPRIHGSTKKMFCIVTNKHGGQSKLELDSLDDEREVEDKYKGRMYSMIYWSEAAEYKQHLTLSTLMQAVRMVGLPDDEKIMLVDANPADSGTAHFLYKFFYEFRIARQDSLDKDDQFLQRCLHVTEWRVDDNPFSSDEEKAMMRKGYENNPDLYARYVEGKWTAVVKDGIFADVFSKSRHCSGDMKNPDPLDELVPESGCAELITSHDAGGVNPVSYIMEKVFRTEESGREVSVFKVLDELAFIGEEIQVSEFTLLFMEKMDYWERECGTQLDWSACWADSSALNFRESISARTVADEMFAVSNGRLRLHGVDKGRGSVANRIRLVRKLLIQNRIIISTKCPRLVEMFQCINRGRIDGTIAAHSKHKHSLDAFSYGLSRELWSELQDSVLATRRITKPSQTGLISVGL